MAASLSVLLAIMIVNIIKTKGDGCSYLDMKQGYGVPTDTCILKESYNSTTNNISYIAHCTSSGIEYQQWTDSYTCQGTPTTTTPIDSSNIDGFTEWDYKCGTNVSPDDCNTATIKQTCNQVDDTYYAELTVIINECFNINGSSYQVTCTGNGYSTGNIYKYSSPDCQGSKQIQNNRYFGPDSTGPDANTDCQYYWLCSDEGGDDSNSDSIIDDVTNFEWNAKHIALIVAGVLLCLLLTIICGYCLCCKSKKPKVDTNYIAMENVDNNDNDTVQQRQHQNNLSVTSAPSNFTAITEYDTIPSAPKMSSVDINDNEKLPYGWSKAMTEDGKVYYQNNVTKQTQWEKPMMDNDDNNDDDVELGSEIKRIQTNKGDEGDSTIM
mmetsp:Transcript_1740/g.1458  ORF Transcript_1740/g.1458 Transcript_1740/m.1458 type:complete len:380 (+) Transcript_1740:62-1201(+)|eukprot:CAMPEP_0201576718 /NCGR_PEP_ID=MMETSP0190_2-20130828/22692_1 /ASSEMBLY_ACC=CAM_ASM_000263 /TAXON_ID=37353 /ORGANISM="Rosalina sp." /LENGTH=379 /DNA_ID=CAMNT_0048007913 /DNA_START=57 /DNA_END=1196 /DNA_ORIENTATION=-